MKGGLEFGDERVELAPSELRLVHGQCAPRHCGGERCRCTDVFGIVHALDGVHQALDTRPHCMVLPCSHLCVCVRGKQLRVLTCVPAVAPRPISPLACDEQVALRREHHAFTLHRARRSSTPLRSGSVHFSPPRGRVPTLAGTHIAGGPGRPRARRRRGVHRTAHVGRSYRRRIPSVRERVPGGLHPHRALHRGLCSPEGVRAGRRAPPVRFRRSVRQRPQRSSPRGPPAASPRLLALHFTHPWQSCRGTSRPDGSALFFPWRAHGAQERWRPRERRWMLVHQWKGMYGRATLPQRPPRRRVLARCRRQRRPKRGLGPAAACQTRVETKTWLDGCR
jgi:hypothetical protein